VGGEVPREWVTRDPHPHELALLGWGRRSNSPLLEFMRDSKHVPQNTDPIKNFFKINKAKVIKLTCLEYLQLKLASPKLLEPIDFG